MSVSVVIVTFEVKDLVARCVASIEGATDIIVVDNASHDGTAAYLSANLPDGWSMSGSFTDAVAKV